MSGATKKTSSKKVKRDDKSDSDNSDDDLQVHFFIPGEKIDTEVLVYYITKYVDSTARITSSRHPTVRQYLSHI